MYSELSYHEEIHMLETNHARYLFNAFSTDCLSLPSSSPSFTSSMTLLIAIPSAMDLVFIQTLPFNPTAVSKGARLAKVDKSGYFV